MEISLESDAEALWQDTLDLLGTKGLPESVLAMLRSCTPVSMEGGCLRVETPMRLVLKNAAKNKELIEECLTEAAFEPMRLEVELGGTKAAPKAPVASTMSREEAKAWDNATSGAPSAPVPTPSIVETAVAAPQDASARKARNPLVEDVGAGDSKLTFDRFVRGDENILAYESAVQVANGVNKGYDLVFIYGKSGLGKTHLLRAVQNYIAKNDPSRVCVYKDASSFISDYVNASRSEDKSAADALRHNYADIDVLIIDDVQSLAGKAGTINFFFDTFNTLRANGKWIVLAADRTPKELGMGKDALDERVTSRMGGGVLVSVQVPSYELKLRLIEKFCENAAEDAAAEHIDSITASIPAEIQRYMAERAGNNIRVIEGFCQRCLLAASAEEKKGGALDRKMVDEICREVWPQQTKTFSVESVQKCVEKFYGIEHNDLIGNRRSKSLMEARHVAVWLSRELCDQTLADIGKHFGGRSHATIMHSLRVVDAAREEDRVFFDRLMRIKEIITRDS